MQLKQLGSHQVAVRAKRVVARTHKAINTYTLGGVGNTRRLTREWHSPHIEIAPTGSERLLSQQEITERFHVAHHLLCILWAITFGHYHHVHLLMAVALILQFHRSFLHLELRHLGQPPQSRIGVETKTVLGVVMLVAITLLKTDVYLMLRPRQAQHLFIARHTVAPLRGVTIFAKQCVVPTTVEVLACLWVGHHHTVFSIVKRVNKTVERTRPQGYTLYRYNLNSIVLTVTHTEIVNTQSVVVEILFKPHILSL